MENEKKRLGFYHSKDLDGIFSGAVLKYKYPDIELRGWDYLDPVPNLNEVKGFDEIIIIDITFPLNTLLEIGEMCNLIVIDHHISFKKELDRYNFSSKQDVNFTYIFDEKLSACEIGSQYLLGRIPTILEMVGEYDTWRSFGKPEWNDVIVPIKFYLYGSITDPSEVNQKYFESSFKITNEIDSGKLIMKYCETMDRSMTNFYSFEKECFGYKALCVNTNFFSSETMKSRFDPTKHDIMVGFSYNGDLWSVSFRSLEGGPDVSEIAKSKGGGGHKHASGCEVKTFEDIFI